MITVPCQGRRLQSSRKYGAGAFDVDIIGDKMTSGLVWSSRDTLLCAVAKTSCSDDKNALITTNSEGNSDPGVRPQ